LFKLKLTNVIVFVLFFQGAKKMDIMKSLLTMVIHIKETLRMTFYMAKELTFSKMVTDMKVFSAMAK